jgi:hypothetical protein
MYVLIMPIFGILLQISMKCKFMIVVFNNNIYCDKSIPCKIWGFHGGDYDDYHLLGDDAVWLL